MVRSLGDRAGGWKRGGVEWGGVGGERIENYVMDDQKDNDVISTAYIYMCLLLWPISIVIMYCMPV